MILKLYKISLITDDDMTIMVINILNLQCKFLSDILIIYYFTVIINWLNILIFTNGIIVTEYILPDRHEINDI